MQSRGSSMELSVVNARIWTGNTARPWVDALAVRGGRIALMGSSAEVQKFAGDETRSINANRSFVVAGTVESTEAYPFDSFDPANHKPLAVGESADFVMLDRDLTRLAPQDIRSARILLTVVAGQIAFQRDENEIT